MVVWKIIRNENIRDIMEEKYMFKFPQSWKKIKVVSLVAHFIRRRLLHDSNSQLIVVFSSTSYNKASNCFEGCNDLSVTHFHDVNNSYRKYIIFWVVKMNIAKLNILIIPHGLRTTKTKL